VRGQRRQARHRSAPVPRLRRFRQRVTASRGGLFVVRQVTVCPACLGRGDVVDRPCTGCAGPGRAVLENRVTIRIPRGIPEGTTLRLVGRGTPGAPPGDAYVVIRTRADSRFAREGADLRCDLHVGPADAALGTTAVIPALDGQVRVIVPPGTQPGDVLPVRGRGLPRFRGGGRGSLNVSVVVDVPRRLSTPQRRLWEQIRAAAAVDAGARVRPARTGRPATSGLAASSGPASGSAPAARRQRSSSASRTFRVGRRCRSATRAILWL
jgi:DnaJ-class molecular chaperone